MKRYNFLLLSSLMILVMFSISCQKSFFTGVNNNPDAPSYVPETNLLPAIENSLAYNQGSLVSRMTSEWTQQIVGSARQQQAYYTYAVTEGDFDAMWSNYYENVMENDVLLIQQADKNGNNEYSGIARLILAYTLQSMVDKWGDMPYSKAFQGTLDLQPDYDHATDLYTTITNLVSDGINELSNSDPGSLVPVDNGADNIYNGNETQWIEFGHAIMARLYIHQSATDPSMASKALTEVSESFQSNADNATYFFSTVEANSAPYYQFNAQRTGDLSYATSYLASLMSSLHDPRYTVYIDSANDPDGFGLAAYYGSNNSPVEFITKDEMDFVQAEAALRATGDFTTAATAYANGITDDMTKLGIGDSNITAYIGNNSMSTSSVQNALDDVAQQEYIALYLNPEEYTTYRRTGFPVLTPPPGAGNAVPRRFLYPSVEYSYNSANTPQASLQSPLLFWDHQ